MTVLNRRIFLAGLASLPIARPSHATLSPYVLSTTDTRVGFSFNLSGVMQSGSMPIRSADVNIDTRQLQNSQVSVVLDVSKARTRLPFARMPMLSPSVLDAKQHPTIRFVSTKIELGAQGRISDGARITGDLTVRGVTRPITLNANLYRQAGTAADDLNTLSIGLTGALNRHDFGASGYPDLVRDNVGLDIHAEISRAR
ncbi:MULTISPECIES: YceI family protein [unclassified Ruegeria]|uniref:YceI family protein n=1 Tax=unclassified Ruegeria TaxID=2625375 RepID=UPI001492A007|nr:MULTISPECIES: YceI family protein [unclassified Ruegeria]NOD75180.1 YceI family protein [Ruegeria sp. HKCCD4332]NOD87141.1 YceI family protein [Ruegeria sp. HKCCD4318]NOE12696.1 YceI family protein [Ruegeria sp. HKCCD4318-2]NOG09139.1 YceI family protein [Ruegeria sp. HKCCD4315]